LAGFGVCILTASLLFAGSVLLEILGHKLFAELGFCVVLGWLGICTLGRFDGVEPVVMVVVVVGCGAVGVVGCVAVKVVGFVVAGVDGGVEAKVAGYFLQMGNLSQPRCWLESHSTISIVPWFGPFSALLLVAWPTSDRPRRDVSFLGARLAFDSKLRGPLSLGPHSHLRVARSCLPLWSNCSGSLAELRLAEFRLCHGGCHHFGWLAEVLEVSSPCGGGSYF
jgi:hypothetical protein